ncbi:MAG: hypothetical protein J7K61_06230 [Thermoplasmata archaeon]|nr:hypothetical protein [Thermoplasmata archaeon]
MEMKWKIAIAIIFILIIASIFAMSNKEKKQEKIELMLSASPDNFRIMEGENVKITLTATLNGEPYETKVKILIKANGSTGQIISPYPSVTNKNGKLSIIYSAPHDINELSHNVEIIANISFGGYNAIATIHGIVYPEMHNTSIIISCDREKIIAGEICHLKASLAYFDERWIPLNNSTIVWRFYVNGKEINEKTSKTNSYGIAKIPFFLSNANETENVTVIAYYPMNLSGEIDLNASESNGIKIEVVPEKPGDFPVVLIHGWIGSTSKELINFTWYNITQKLVAHGFKVLDFDLTKPGIQWLEYEPGWENHHIPWIAAKVSQKIRNALILNGYPPNQTIDIVAHSMGGLVARFMAEHYMADVDYWNNSWSYGDNGEPWYGDGDGDVVIGPEQIDDLIAVASPCHGVPPNINESIIRIINFAKFPWWIAQVPDMVYHSPFLNAMGYRTTELIDYYGIGGDIGWIFGGVPVDFDGDGIKHYSDGLVPAEGPYLEGRPLYILTGNAWPYGEEDHLSLMGRNDKVHEYILEHLID